ncbi:MAG: hypothetical protein IKO56_01045 [Alphaproteobacteria bacterium]|nr:hypothetical protein [Alphaproteobacteria bacterium]
MKLRYITCSDPREHNSIKSIIDLAHLPHAEVAVQCHPSKMSKGMPRNVWFNDLLYVVNQGSRISLAIHINQEWANDICAGAKIPNIVLDWIKLEKSHNKPLIKRIQLNMPKTTAANIDTDGLAKIIHDFPHHEFIFQYNDNTKSAIEKMHNTGAKFSLLFDASGGNGIAPKAWQKPIYETHPMGYSGGMSPDNVIENLNKINAVVPEHRDIWIDAEGKLKSQTMFSEKALFDTELAKGYVRRANAWQKKR